MKPVFIVGNSRSGTTMMMRIMNNHSRIHSINEPHFFEKLWSPGDEGRAIEAREAGELLGKLFTGQREGFFASAQKHRYKFTDEIQQLLKSDWDCSTRLATYSSFLYYESQLHHKDIPCEKTPQNVFYIQELLDKFPEALIINMVRDPRAVLLSQKRKWKRRSLGATFLTEREMLRLRINYHPITISKLWNAAIAAAVKYSEHPRVVNVRFEDLVATPEITVQAICSRIAVPYEAGMLAVPQSGSSTVSDESGSLGIRPSRAKGWKDSGLSAAEIYLCQALCKEGMKRFNYAPIPIKSDIFSRAWLYSTFPVKLSLAFAFNLGRMRSIADTLKRRLQAKP